MKVKLLDRFDEKRVKGYEMEVDKIKYDPRFTGHFAFRVVNEWKKPTYLAITWFIEIPDEEK